MIGGANQSCRQTSKSCEPARVVKNRVPAPNNHLCNYHCTPTVEKKIGELAVSARALHAEAVFRSDADQELVDERVPTGFHPCARSDLLFAEHRSVKCARVGTNETLTCLCHSRPSNVKGSGAVSFRSRYRNVISASSSGLTENSATISASSSEKMVLSARSSPT